MSDRTTTGLLSAVAKLEEVGGWLEQWLRQKDLRQGWAWHGLSGVFRDVDVRV